MSGRPPCQRPECTDDATPPEYDLCRHHHDEAEYPRSSTPDAAAEPSGSNAGKRLVTDGGEQKTRDELYEDRNKAVLGFLGMLDRATPDEGPVRVGWHPPTDSDDADAEEWAVVWAEYPLGAPLDTDEPTATEQLSWHLPRPLAEGTPWLPREYTPWDGHTRGEKIGRLTRLIQGL